MNTRTPLLFISALISAVVLSGCGNADDGQEPVRIEVDFNDTSTVWVGGYSDYSEGTEPEVVTELRSLPAPFVGNGFYAFGRNYSDDLFVYIKSRFSGFSPNTRYRFFFDIRFITNTPIGCVGVGGPPAEAVALKGGASVIEPISVLIGSDYRMNIDKGNQGSSGPDALVLGHIGGSNTDCDNLYYESRTLTSPSPLDVTTDASGTLWILFGTDSGFESASHIYYQSVGITAYPL